MPLSTDAITNKSHARSLYAIILLRDISQWAFCFSICILIFLIHDLSLSFDQKTRNFRVDALGRMSVRTIFWFRKGLRLHDNPALLKALSDNPESIVFTNNIKVLVARVLFGPVVYHTW